MKRRLFSSLGVALGLLVPGCAHEAASRPGATVSRPTSGPLTLAPYASPSGFLVLMPPDPKLEHRTQQTLGGPVQTEIAEARGYVASVSILPELAVQTMDAKSLLRTAESTSVKELRAKLLGSKEITGDGLPGREFIADGPGGRVAGRLLLGGAQLYSLMATYPADAPAPIEVNEFLGSFRRANPQ